MEKTYKKSTVEGKENVVVIKETIVSESEQTLEDVNNDIVGLELRLEKLKAEKTAIINALK